MVAFTISRVAGPSETATATTYFTPLAAWQKKGKERKKAITIQPQRPTKFDLFFFLDFRNDTVVVRVFIDSASNVYGTI